MDLVRQPNWDRGFRIDAEVWGSTKLSFAPEFPHEYGNICQTWCDQPALYFFYCGARKALPQLRTAPRRVEAFVRRKHYIPENKMVSSR